ncbi:MAG: hypothetical protein IJ109_06375 [Firmicutes bacterium]|nr:hypothetical protein [Bacillota bacterium]
MSQRNRTHSRTARGTLRNDIRISRINLLTMTTDLIREQVRTDREQIDLMKQELALIEQAALRIHHQEGEFHFSCRNTATSEMKGISTDPDRIHRLARRAFLENRIAAIEGSARRLDRVLQSAEERRFEEQLRKKTLRYSASGLDLCRILFTKEQNEWIDAFYSPNPFYQEDLIYPTDGGLLTRSKSEAWFGSSLEQFGLPYRYDDLVTIRSEQSPGRPQRNNYFADFKIPNLLGGITIHEHFGAFQVDHYSDNALQRLNDYRSFSVAELPSRPVRAEEFTWSLEADLHDKQAFRRVLRRILLPGSC